MESHASTFGQPLFEYSPRTKYLMNTPKRSIKTESREVRVMKIDPSRDIFDSPNSKFCVTKIYTGTIEALNPMPGVLRDPSPSRVSDSVEKFEH